MRLCVVSEMCLEISRALAQDEMMEEIALLFPAIDSSNDDFDIPGMRKDGKLIL